MTRASRFAVIDCETTGFGKNDRIVEFALVLIDGTSLETIDEFDTLVNPERDVGKTQIHGITAGMVSAAPTIDEVIPAIEDLITGSVLVAHNLSFDMRMLSQECDRVDATLRKGSGLCTYKMSGMKLVSAASNLGLNISNHHRALEDARLAAEIFLRLFDNEDSSPATLKAAKKSSSNRSFHTLRREAVTDLRTTPLKRLLERSFIPSASDAVGEYFAILDLALGDLTLSDEESSELRALQSSLGLVDSRINELHLAYLDSVTRAALRDGHLSSDEAQLIQTIADLLSIKSYEMPFVESESPTFDLRCGSRVCFTGEFVDNGGKHISRDELEMLAARLGYQAVSNVSKKGCDAVLAADPNSQSGKCKKAREYQIPVISISDFIKLCE